MRGWRNLDASIEALLLAHHDELRGLPLGDSNAGRVLGLASVSDAVTGTGADPDLLDELLEDRLVERLLSEGCTCRR